MMAAAKYDIDAAVAQMSRVIFNPKQNAVTVYAVKLGRRLAVHLLDNHCGHEDLEDKNLARIWGEALIVGAASIGSLAVGGAPEPTMRTEPNALRLAVNVQAFAGWYLVTGVDPR